MSNRKELEFRLEVLKAKLNTNLSMLEKRMVEDEIKSITEILSSR